ncbi:MAG: cytochrome c biogenesis CcdA family protein [Candidatus Dojkabacteria bacterium]
MQEVNFITAFGAGLLTFFAPCTFVTLPTFISYLIFQATGEETIRSGKRYKLKVLLSAVSYVSGFLLVFTLLGVTATGVGSLFSRNKDLLTNVGAIVIILFGLLILFGERVKKLQFLFKEKKVEVNTTRFGKGYVFPFIIGVTSAFAWTPCIGPILGGILFLAGTSTDTALQGGALLFTYGLGISIPFILIAVFLGSAQKWMRKINRYTGTIHKISALLLIILGVMLLTGFADQAYGFLFRLFTSIGYMPK